MNRALLEKPFLDSEIKHREGNHGTVSYVDGATVIQRLNDSFDGNWSFEISDYGHDEDNNVVWAVCKLTAENVVKMQFGSSSVTLNKTTQKPVAIVDDMKAAATDALKKAASLFGIGIGLWKNEARTQSAPSPDTVPVSVPTSQASTTQLTTGRLSQKQFGYIQNLARENGMTKRELDLHCQAKFGGVVLAHITKHEASLLIEEFNNPERTPLPQVQPLERQTVGGVH